VHIVLAVTPQVRLFLYVPPALTFSDSALCPYSVFLTFPTTLTVTVIVSPSNINLLVLIRENTMFSVREGQNSYIAII
jgi:hypothetical protein